MQAYISCPIGIHMVGFVMATYGAVTATFVFIFSRLARRSGRLALFLLAAVINLVLLIILYNWTPDSSMTTLIFIIPSVWGLSQAIWQTQTNGKCYLFSLSVVIIYFPYINFRLSFPNFVFVAILKIVDLPLSSFL